MWPKVRFFLINLWARIKYDPPKDYGEEGDKMKVYEWL